jgi:hypothetical protein
MKGGTPDGDYGNETLAAVRAFRPNMVSAQSAAGGRAQDALALDRALGAAPPRRRPEMSSPPCAGQGQGVQDPGSRRTMARWCKAGTEGQSHRHHRGKVQDDNRLSGNVVINVGGTAQWNTPGGASEEPAERPGRAV